MERHEVDALLSEGMAAEHAGRVEEAKICAATLIDAIRLARSQRKTDGGGERAIDREAMDWAMSVIHRH
jgi:hypothetical protein